MAKYCTSAVWEDERRAILDGMSCSGLLSPGRLAEYFTAWWCVIECIRLLCFTSVFRRRYERLYCGLIVLEWYMDIQAQARKFTAWFGGLWRTGFEGAHKAAAGLS